MKIRPKFQVETVKLRFLTVMAATLLEGACGLCTRREEVRFTANQNELVSLVAARNTARAAFSRIGGFLQLKLVAQAATKALKRR